MSRPLRLEFPGAVYHVTSRGDGQQVIYCYDTDRFVWLDILAKTCARFNFAVHSFCQMTNHYHVLLETGDANLARGMRELNGSYSQYFNRRHQVVGHVFQGRYQAILVQKDSHLREVARYIVLNPVRARMVADVSDWRWSSYAFMVQQAAAPGWLQTDWLLSQFGESRPEAIAAYQRFVSAGLGAASPFREMAHQLLLGDAAFIARHRNRKQADGLQEIPRVQRRALALTLEEYQSQCTGRDAAIIQAYQSTAYSMAQIARHFGVSCSTVSRIIRSGESS